jgi:hypothetical protein
MQKDHVWIVETVIILFLFKHSKRFPKTKEKLQNFMQKYEEQNSICKCRVSDPDLHGSALIWVTGYGSAFKLWIRFRIQDRKNDPQK